MKTESELFGTTMLIVLIINIVYTLHAMQGKLKDPIRSIFSSAFICVCPQQIRIHAVIPEKFHPVKFFSFQNTRMVHATE